MVAKKFYRAHNTSEGYPLKVGNIIKFGRVQYIVVEMKTDKLFGSMIKSNDLKDLSGY